MSRKVSKQIKYNAENCSPENAARLSAESKSAQNEVQTLISYEAQALEQQEDAVDAVDAAVIAEPAMVVSVKACYLGDQSDPGSQRFIWSYEVSITNQRPEIVQLLNRYFRIMDMNGKIEEVQGVGVVGLQPIIKPGKTFHYSSICHLTTPQGTMEGHYGFHNLDDEEFLATIPKFLLTAPAAVTKLFRWRLH